MDDIIKRSQELKQALVDFVLDAEGDLAESLEAYAAAQSRTGRYDNVQQDLIIDTFLTEGKVGDKTPLDLFLESQLDLSESDRQLLSGWQRSFIGLFAVTQILPGGFDLWNWLTAKQYLVTPNDAKTVQELSRVKEGDILLTRIAPISDTDWIFSGPCIQMGKLGKPKLAVAIGNFKENHKNALYSDAPELLEQSWQSVQQYHQDFLDFFGSDEVTLPGYQLNKKIAEFQEIMTQKRLTAVGIDPSKSLAEVVEEAGIGEEELKAAAAEAGADSSMVSQVVNSNNKAKMVMPKVDLPAELKKAEQVTALSHPQWGQMFLPTHSQFKAMMEAEDWQSVEGSEKLVRHYLESPTINAFVWQRLAQQYPQLEKVLQTVLNRPDFKLDRDLNSVLQEFGKPVELELPEIASVPLHLHNLFQEAVVEINKKSKSKTKKKTASGFQT